MLGKSSKGEKNGVCDSGRMERAAVQALGPSSYIPHKASQQQKGNKRKARIKHRKMMSMHSDIEAEV